MSTIGSEHASAASENLLAVWQRNAARHSPQRQAAGKFTLISSGQEIRIPIEHLDDIVKARRSGSLLASQMGCSGSRIALILTAISELGRNIISYAGVGEIVLSRSNRGVHEAVVVVASDHGPGIHEFSAENDRSVFGAGEVASNNGLGLRGLKMCMDHFSIESQAGAGTRVTCEVFSN